MGNELVETWAREIHRAAAPDDDPWETISERERLQWLAGADRALELADAKYKPLVDAAREAVDAHTIKVGEYAAKYPESVLANARRASAFQDPAWLVRLRNAYKTLSPEIGDNDAT